MKKTLIIIGLVLVVLVVGGYVWWETRPPTLVEMCNASNGGWAPVGPIEYNTLIDCNGKRLTKDSSLIDWEGYTCYCHTENTCWNGRECVPMPSSTTSN